MPALSTLLVESFSFPWLTSEYPSDRPFKVDFLLYTELLGILTLCGYSNFKFSFLHSLAPVFLHASKLCTLSYCVQQLAPHGQGTCANSCVYFFGFINFSPEDLNSFAYTLLVQL